MSAQHTPGRIFLAEAVTGRYSKTNMRRVRSESEGLEHGAICEVYGIADGSPAHANARRLVACWNACEGYPTEVLEHVASTDDTLAGRFILVAQRDDLLAAAVRAEAFISGFDDDNTQDDVAGMLRDLRAAIAKVEGGAA